MRFTGDAGDTFTPAILNPVAMAFFCTLALLVVGQFLGAWQSVAFANGGMIIWLTAAIAFLAIAVCARAEPETEERARKALPVLLVAVLSMFAAGQLFASYLVFRTDIAIWLLLTGLVLLYNVRRKVPSLHECRTRILPVVMLGFLLVSIRTIRNDPHPPIDVFVAQQAAAEGMSKLRNPYTATIPDIYGPASPYYIPLTENGRTLYGSSYPPLITILNLPAFLLAGDIRYGYVLLLLLSCGLIALMQTSWPALCGAVLLLMNPFSQLLIVWAWVEPVAILTFCLTLFSVSRYPKAVPWLLGLFLASKQTNLAILPLALMLVENPWEWKKVAGFFAKALAVVGAIYIPFYLWDPAAFVLSLITVQLKIPMRRDEISYAAYAARNGWFVLPIWLPFLWLPVGIYLGLRKAPRSAAGFAAASALTLITFFALSKQGAANYYFLVLGMLCCSLGLMNMSYGDQSQFPADTKVSVIAPPD